MRAVLNDGLSLEVVVSLVEQHSVFVKLLFQHKCPEIGVPVRFLFPSVVGGLNALEVARAEFAGELQLTDGIQKMWARILTCTRQRLNQVKYWLDMD